ncbi:MAG: zinc-binding dehydrogenase [Pseudomonadota bacterium]
MTDIQLSKTLKSLVTTEGILELSLAELDVPNPEGNQVLVQMEAVPINPTDLALMFGPADLTSVESEATAAGPLARMRIPEKLLGAVRSRIGESLGAGFEGAGRVVGAGESEAAQALLGQTVALTGDGLFTRYCCVDALQVTAMGESISPKEAASSFVNPMTALGMVETMRREGHTAVVHTAAASNLGRILNRVCIAEGVSLINIVRKPEQVALLKEEGAAWVLDSSEETFRAHLTEAIAETGATLAFDALGGGKLGNTILSCMERAIASKSPYNRYGSDTYKQLYIYGRLDLSPTQLTAAYGFAWGVGGWLLSQFMEQAGADKVEAMKARIKREIKSTFASQYSAEISLEEALSPENISRYSRRATGEKFLINPAK